MTNRSSDRAPRPDPYPRSDAAGGGWDGGPGAQRVDRPRELSISQLLAAVEHELIPRLLLPDVAAPAPVPTAVPKPSPPDPDDWSGETSVARFAAWSVESDEGRLAAYVSAQLARGVELDAIYLHLLAPAARHLGELWESDEMSFVDVQLGLCRLHRLVCECHEAAPWAEPLQPPMSILLGSAPGDQHTFGVTLAADFFRRRGWQVTNLCGLDERVLLDRLTDEHFSATGFSLHNEKGIGALTTLIGQVRASARNPDILVMVGGDYFVREPSAASEVGADLTASDARQAVRVAEAAIRGARRTA